jgi:hypothetical protein
MNRLSQNETGDLTERRVKERLESMGFKVIKPIPDVGIDFEVFYPNNPKKRAKIQVKGRNPRHITTYRWFQLRVPKSQLEYIKAIGLPPDETWREKVRQVDFFILDAVGMDEMWVLNQEQVFRLIELNEYQYSSRPDNVFTYNEPIKGKQKEMNMEAIVPGTPIIKRFADCKNNFNPIKDFLS